MFEAVTLFIERKITKKVGQMLAMSSHRKTKNKVHWFGVMGPAVLVGA